MLKSTLITVATALFMASNALGQGYPIVRSQQYGVIVASVGYISPSANNTHTPLFVELAGSNADAFGDIVADERTPVLQMDFTYGFNVQTSSLSAINGAVIESSSSRLRLQTGTGATGSAIMTSVLPARYRPGQGVTARFTGLWDTSAANSKQFIGMGDNGDGYFFGYSGTAFGILHKNRGVETFISTTDWNHDKMDGTGPSGMVWDKTKGNIMQIAYPYLGYGSIKFSIQEEEHGHMTLVHEIRYTNAHVNTQLSNPSLKFKAYATNSGNTTNLNSYVGSIGVFITGKRIFLGPQYGVSNIKTGVTTESNIFAIRNATTYNGIVNTGVLRLRSLSFANDNATAIGQMRIIKGATIGGSPVFAPISGTTADNGVTITGGQSATSYDIAGTTGTGGYTAFNTLASRNTSQEIDLTPYNIFLSPGEVAIFAAQCSAATGFGISVNWNEDN